MQLLHAGQYPAFPPPNLQEIVDWIQTTFDVPLHVQVKHVLSPVYIISEILQHINSETKSGNGTILITCIHHSTHILISRTCSVTEYLLLTDHL